jgi:RNA polymerase sigma-70 factor (ECF subfamily)
VTLEQDFTAWAEHADPDALARVFDATAGRLLLLAAHLTGSGATAEDLVQATFLAAMARGATWDRQRPVWPWLATILHNEANMQRRRQGRRREVGIDAAAGAATTSPDPAHLAASEEAFAAVVRAIDALPLPYRRVLRLRLVHGLQQIEIARALEVPVGTVRAQVHRGLEKLRGTLPTGVALAAGAWLTGDGALLAQVRTHVLAEAAAMHGAASAAVTTTGVLLTGGWWTMHGKTVGVVAAGLVLLLCLGFALGVPPMLDAGEQPREPRSPAVADLGGEAKHPAPMVTDAPERSEVENASGPAWPLVVTVQAKGGEPIAGATVRVWVAARGTFLENQQQGDGMPEEVASGETAADGTFRCALDPFRQRSPLFRSTNWIYVTAAHGQRSSRQVAFIALPRTAEPHEFAEEIEIEPAIGIVGRVVDGRGTPVRDADLYWLPPPPEMRCETASGYAYAEERLREDGGFCIVVRPDQPERLSGRIAAIHASLGIAVAALPGQQAGLAAGELIDVGTLVLDGRDAIRGHVVLADGSPLADYPMTVREIDPELAAKPIDIAAVQRLFFRIGRTPRPVEVRRGRPLKITAAPITLADGSFLCAGLDPEATYAVGVRDSAMRMSAVVARPGDAPVRLVVDRQLLRLDVRDEAGASLLGARIHAEGYDPTNTRPNDRPRPGFPATGYSVGNPTYSVDPQNRLVFLSPFGWIWRFATTDEGIQPEAVRHEAFAGVYRAERTIVLRPETRFGALHLVVVDEHGKPFAGRNQQGNLQYETDLRCAERGLQRTGRRQYPPDDGMFRDLPAGRWQLSVFLGIQLRFPLDAYPRGIHEREVVIEDGRTTEVTIEAKAAGLAGFQLQSDTPPASGTWEDVKIRAAPGDTDVGFEVYDRANPMWGIKPLRPGVTLIGKPSYPPGRHSFVITVKGYHPARCDVDVVADGMTEVDVTLFPL